MRTILVFGLVGMLAVARLGAQSEPVSGILAIVNNNVITYGEVTAAVAPSVELLMAQHGNEPEVFRQKMMALQRERIEDLVARQLILTDFTNAGYNLPESVIEDRIRERIRQDYYGDRAKLMKTLQEQGLTSEKYRKSIRENIIINVLREKHVVQELIISPAKIEEYYQTNQARFKEEDKVKLRMIVLNKNKDNPGVTRQIAMEIISKLDAGVPFEEMASIHSEGSQRGQGGDWGWADRKMLLPELAKVAFTLKPKERSGIIENAESYFIMLVEDVRLARIKPMAEVREEIEKNLIVEEQDRLYKKWIDRLKAKAFIRYF